MVIHHQDQQVAVDLVEAVEEAVAEVVAVEEAAAVEGVALVDFSTRACHSKPGPIR